MSLNYYLKNSIACCCGLGFINGIVITYILYEMKTCVVHVLIAALLLNQAHAWFLEIAFAWEVSMHVYTCVCMCVCVCVCVRPQGCKKQFT